MKFNKTYALMAILLISIMTVSGVIAFNRTSQTQQFNPDITTTLKLTVTHNGQNTTRVVHDDLILDNFNLFITGILLPTTACCANYQTSLTNTAGSTYTITYTVAGINNGPNCNSQDSASTFNALCGGSTYGSEVYLGTGTKTISRTIFQVQTQYGNPFGSASSVCNSGNPANIVVQSSESAPSTASITEAGFTERLNSGAGTVQPFLFTYETFTAVPVTIGDTISVQYTFNLNNAGVNRNFCNMLAVLFTATSTQTTWTAYDNSGTTWTLCGWIFHPDSPTNYQCTVGSNVGNPIYSSIFFIYYSQTNGAGNYVCSSSTRTSPNDMFIWIGTGVTTFGFSTNGLTSPVGASPSSVSGTTYTSGLQTSFIFINENTFNPASTITATEMGMFISEQAQIYPTNACTTPTTATPYFLLWGTSLPSISMPSGQNNALTVQISD